MRINRLFVDEPLRTGAEIEIGAEQSHHLTRVLRLKAGATLAVFDGIGNEYADEICFQASIRPDCKVSDLSDEQLTRVHKYLRRVLRRATLHWQAAHADPGWLINRRRSGRPGPTDFRPRSARLTSRMPRSPSRTCWAS